MSNKSKKETKEKKNDNDPSKGMVVLPYIEGLSEKLQRIFWKHRIATAMRPHNTLRNLLVHPKDKIESNKTCEVVYRVDCKGCDKTYIGETGRAFGTRLKEHQKDAEKVKNRTYTRAKRKESLTEQNKSAITDHIAQENHVINCEGAKIIDKDSNQFTRKIREAMWIRRRGNKTMNRDIGMYSLDHVYDSLLNQSRTCGNETTKSHGGKCN
ncbi:uncharacterized protein [Amphiura filiformis]|uniref:uncharacterized protein n=1 Tax=Amphiura filiformis TaxID=82378 RepID=UPI003B227434